MFLYSNGTSSKLKSSIQVVKASKKNLSLSPQQGRPVKGFGKSFDACILERIRSYRSLHEKWGAKTILVELVEKDKYLKEDLPSYRTIERYLKSLNLSQSYEKHRPLEGTTRCKATESHDCWQMDDKGVEYYSGVGHVGMINIKDVYSCVHTQSFGIPLPHKRSHPTMSDYQCALRLAFSEFGLPKRIQADHGSNFYENRSKSPFPTTLHLWLVGLGISLEWARIYRPTDQSKVERTHQTLHDQVQQSLDFTSWDNFKRIVDLRRHRLNNHIVCDTLGQPPLVAYPQALHSSRYFNPLTEHSLLDTNRIKEYLHLKEWFRKVSDAKTISLGGYVYYLTKAQAQKELKITFDKDLDNLIFYDDKELVAQLPFKGLEFQNLVEPEFYNTLKSLQFELPFNWANAKINTTF